MVGIPPIEKNGEYHVSSGSKSEVLNDYFSSVFAPQSPRFAPLPCDRLEDVRPEAVACVISKIVTRKSSGSFLLTNGIPS